MKRARKSVHNAAVREFITLNQWVTLHIRLITCDMINYDSYTTIRCMSGNYHVVF